MTAVASSPNRPFSAPASSKLITRDTEKIFKIADKIIATRYLQMQKKRRDMMSKPVARTYIPRMDLCDDENMPRIFAAIELPGIERDSLTLQVINEKLCVEGQRAMPLKHVLSGYPYPNRNGSYQSLSRSQLPPISIINEHGQEIENHDQTTPRYTTRELAFGKFKREIELPQGTISTQVTADLVEGMLYVSWPRNPQTGTGVSGGALSSSVTSASPSTTGRRMPSLSRATLPAST
ncbi:hypothetical protein QCA50_013148 [Cerrena zonata]|uniref:SHSP domain-containing protein n=1 Tax=Cerrena zonata TaxID=2478898 RepID=A0AAW0G2I4_9APHY